MSGRSVSPFPWSRLPRIERAAVQAQRELRARLDAALDLGRIESALRELLGDDVALERAELGACSKTRAPTPTEAQVFVVRFRTAGVRMSVRPEADLVRGAVARLLDQDFQLGWADTGIDAALRGAGAALLLETLRRAARGEAPELTSDATPANDWLLSGTVTLRLGDKPYRLELLVEVEGAPGAIRPRRVCLAELGAVRLRVPWVCAVSSATLGELESLAVGDVWLPGNDGWLAGEPALSVGLLVPARADRGMPVRVSGGRSVLGAEPVAVVEEWDASMSQDESELEQVVGATPLVVRLELGSMEMSAAEWAALRPGDVIETGRRIDQTVVLRTGGREIARGELVEVEGEVGVRITQVGLAKGAP